MVLITPQIIQTKNGPKITPEPPSIPNEDATSYWNMSLDECIEISLLNSKVIRSVGQVRQSRNPSSAKTSAVTVEPIREGISRVQLETAVGNHLSELVKSYWQLNFFYRNLKVATDGRESALKSWRDLAKAANRDDASLAQGKEQYFFFRGRVEEAKRDLKKTERRLRYLCGLAASDGRTIRPTDAPPTNDVSFDWDESLKQALTESFEIKRQKTRVQQQEKALKAAKESLLPTLDQKDLYRWLGLGDHEAEKESKGSVGDQETLEWRRGVDFDMPIGMRRELAKVRNAQLQYAREKAKLEDIELELSHALSDAVQNLNATIALMTTANRQERAAQEQVESLEGQREAGAVTWDFLLDAQRRQADASVAYYQSLMQYAFSIIEVHFRKGTLLEEFGVEISKARS